MAALRYVVEGGRQLSGTIRPAGNKNAALPIVAAALLTEDEVFLENVPRIRDIETLVLLLRSVGAEAEWTGLNSLRIKASDIHAGTLDPVLCEKIRGAILLAGPLLARCGSVTLPPPGGDVIGRRRLDTHFLAFEALGATFTAGAEFTITDSPETRKPSGRMRSLFGTQVSAEGRIVGSSPTASAIRM